MIAFFCEELNLQTHFRFSSDLFLTFVQKVLILIVFFGFKRKHIFIITIENGCSFTENFTAYDINWMSFIITALSTSHGKTLLAFFLNDILFGLTISYQKSFVFSVPVFYSQICTRLCFRHLSESRVLLGALHRSKFANFCNDVMQKPFVVTTYAQKVLF